jgi:hypothetical protein
MTENPYRSARLLVFVLVLVAGSALILLPLAMRVLIGASA